MLQTFLVSISLETIKTATKNPQLKQNYKVQLFIFKLKYGLNLFI